MLSFRLRRREPRWLYCPRISGNAGQGPGEWRPLPLLTKLARAYRLIGRLQHRDKTSATEGSPEGSPSTGNTASATRRARRAAAVQKQAAIGASAPPPCDSWLCSGPRTMYNKADKASSGPVLEHGSSSRHSSAAVCASVSRGSARRLSSPARPHLRRQVDG